MRDFALDRNVHKEPRLNLELVGTHDIFRFAVNLLDDQIEFMALGRVILVELREMSNADSFDSWAKEMLGKDRHDRVASYFLRDTHCVVCEQELHPNATRRNLPEAKIVCADCDVTP